MRTSLRFIGPFSIERTKEAEEQAGVLARQPPLPVEDNFEGRRAKFYERKIIITNPSNIQYQIIDIWHVNGNIRTSASVESRVYSQDDVEEIRYRKIEEIIHSLIT